MGADGGELATPVLVSPDRFFQSAERSCSLGIAKHTPRLVDGKSIWRRCYFNLL